MTAIIYIMIYLGSALMVYNIARYLSFMRRAEWMGRAHQNRLAVHVPMALLVLFLIGYLCMGLFGHPDLLVSMILFGGSVFVMLVVHLLHFIANRVEENDSQLQGMYSELMANADDETDSSLAAFRVNLTKDQIESRAGCDLFDSDLTSAGYTEMMNARAGCLTIDRDHAACSMDMGRDALLARFAEGQRTISRVVFCHRQRTGACFVRWHAALAVRPDTGDVVAFITEREYNTDMVNQALLRKALVEQYDMITYIVDDSYGVVIGSENRYRRGSIFPKALKGKYDRYIDEEVVPFVDGDDGERAAVARVLGMEQVRQALTTREPYEVNIRLRIDGEEYFNRFVYYTVDREAGFYILLKSDTTDVRREELERSAALQRALDDARSANAAKTVFFSSMSHDIRTPMNAVIGYTTLARREGATEAQMREYLDKIASSSQHLLALINDVLEMSRIESGHIDLEATETDLKALLDGARDMFAAQMESKGIEYVTRAVDLRDSRVLCDRNRLNRVLLNLLSNAFKFTPEGGHVTVTLGQTGAGDGMGHYELRVKDSGIGMSEAFAERVFDAFEREQTSTVSGIQGTGLGMAITKNIVDLMGGSIDVETAPGQGTEFIVKLSFPLASGADADPDGPRTAATVPNFSCMKLLLVEDNAINREIATLILAEAGFDLETAVNGMDAVEKLRDSRPGEFDAVLMDVQMPVMNGYTATRLIRSLDDPSLSSIPVIAMTANAFAEDIQREQEAGMNAHITKPLDVSAMMATLAEVLR